jgi:heparin binding hemagglutinin HbhA
MSEPKTNRIPAPLYAAAGAGELAIEHLRKLPAVVGVLGTRVVADLGGRAVLTGFELRQKATETLRTANETAGTLRERAQAELDLAKLRESADLAKLREAADLDKLRAAATRNAIMVFAGAQAAQERAYAAYGALVARGERVVGAGVLEAAETVNADIEATEAVTPVTATPTSPAATPADVPTPADVAEIAEAKPAAVKKATRAPKAAKPAATPSAKLPGATKRTRPAAE